MPPAPLVKDKASEPAKQQVTTAGFDLAYLPADADVVVHVDLARMRQSKLWPTYADDVAKVVAPAFVGCDYKPTNDAATVDAGFPITSKVNVVVFRGVDRDKALACITKKVPEPPQQVVVHGDVVTATSATNVIRDIAFVDAHTMVIRSATTALNQSMEATLKASADAPLGKDAGFVAAAASSKMATGVLVVSRPGSAALAAQMNPSSMKLGYFAGTLDLNTQLAVHYMMKVGSEAEAKQLMSTMKGQLETPSVKQMFDRLETSSQGDTITVDFVMGETKLSSMAGMFRALLPAP